MTKRSKRSKRRLYLVRWQNLSAAFVMARDEHELLDILDEEADTAACSWWEYDGPLFLDFDLPFEWKHVNKTNEDEDPSPGPEGWVPENICITKMPDDPRSVKDLAFRLAGCDTSFEAEEKIFKLAFPRLHEVLFEDDDGNDDGPWPEPEKIAAAARDEIARTMREHRRILRETERRAAAGDRNAELALLMGTSVEQVQNMRQDCELPALPAEQALPPLVPPPDETGD